MSTTDTELHSRIDALDSKVDYSDPATYADLLGYGAEAELPTEVDEPSQGDTETTEETTEAAPAAAAPAPAATESSATPAAANPAKDDDGAVAGVATKDGKRVIPYAVLKETRESASQAVARAQELAEANARLQAQLDAAMAGKTSTTTASDAEVTYTAEQIAEMELDFPEQARQAKAIMALQEKLARIAQAAPAASPAPAAAPAPAAQATDPATTVQEAIDNLPLLTRWQSKGGAAWAEAVKVDAALKNDPAWANKPIAERFAEVQKRVADDLGIPIPASQDDTTTAAAPAPAAPGAKPRTTTATPTLDDMSGGPVVSSSDPLGGMSRSQMVDKAMGMSVEELHRMAGLAY